MSVCMASPSASYTIRWRASSPWPAKAPGHESDGEVSAARLGADVARMFMAFVDDGEVLGRQRLGEALADHLNARRRHGSTCLNGFTLTPAYTPALQ